jgi:hypothetical protein
MPTFDSVNITDGAGTPVVHAMIERNLVSSAKSYGVQYIEEPDTDMELKILTSYDESPTTYTRKLVKVKGFVVNKAGDTVEATVNHTYMLPKGVDDAVLRAFTVAANNVVHVAGFDSALINGIA